MELDRSRDRSFHRAKVEQSSVLSMVEGSWRAREEEMGIVEREAIRGGDRDSRQITSG